MCFAEIASHLKIYRAIAYTDLCANKPFATRHDKKVRIRPFGTHILAALACYTLVNAN